MFIFQNILIHLKDCWTYTTVNQTYCHSHYCINIEYHVIKIDTLFSCTSQRRHSVIIFQSKIQKTLFTFFIFLLLEIEYCISVEWAIDFQLNT